VLGENDNVYAAQCPVLTTETFSADPPHPIAPHRGGNFLLGHGETYARLLATIVPVQNGEIAVGGTPGTGKYLLKFSGFQESRVTTKAMRYRGHDCILLAGGCARSVRQASALFLAPAFQHKAAAFGRHTGTKTVGTFALDDAGLISTFHFSGLLRCGSALLLSGLTETRALGPKKEREGYAAGQALSILADACG